MSQAAFARKLARLNRGMQAQVGAARLPTLGMVGGCDPRAAREMLIEEQDRRREYLAEEVLKIFAEEADPYQFLDTCRTEAKSTKDGDVYETQHASLTLSEWAEKLAHAALAAATVLYPEIPEALNDAASTDNKENQG